MPFSLSLIAPGTDARGCDAAPKKPGAVAGILIETSRSGFDAPKKLRYCRCLLNHVQGWSGYGRDGLGVCWMLVRSPGKAMDEVIRRPWAGKLHVALAHRGAGCGEFVLVALNVFAVDQMGDIKHHLAVFH